MSGAPLSSSVDFFGPRLKLERAEHHIRDLEEIFRRYVNENMKRIRAKSAQDARQLAFGRTIGGRLPDHTATVLGDAVHNLRASLDHAYCVLVKAHTGSVNEWIHFPFHKDRNSLEGTIKGHVQKGFAPRPEILSVILNEIEPIENGRLKLYGLHRLDIVDKHVVLIPTTRIVNVEKMEILDEVGRVVQTISGISVQIKGDTRATAFALPNNREVKFHGEANDAFDVRFDQGQPFEGESVLTTLKTLSLNVKLALDLLETAK